MIWKFQSYFHELFLTPPGYFSVCVYKHLWTSHFAETKIYVKFDPKAANAACSYHLKSGTIYSKRN